MNFEKNKNLKEYNTFGIKSIAKYFISITDKQQLIELSNNPIFKDNRAFVLGGGSNILLPDFYDGLIISIDTQGISLNENEDFYYLNIQAGENWHNFVKYTVNNNYYGLENLALIPGKVGAAPIQNIGAYGVEQNLFFESCEYFNIEDGKFYTIKNEECNFSYRNSIFKNKFKGKVIITEVIYKLNKTANYNISYNELKSEFEGKEYNSKDIFDLVCEVRRNKLPDPKVLGNSGSFFKNPIIPISLVKKLMNSFSDIKYFEYDKTNYKISAGWLIENVGLKGYRVGDAGVSENHSLILVNYGNSSSKDIVELANFIIKEVEKKFEIKLEMEVNLI